MPGNARQHRMKAATRSFPRRAAPPPARARAQQYAAAPHEGRRPLIPTSSHPPSRPYAVGVGGVGGERGEEGGRREKERRKKKS
ncbi:hypothetical protein GQ55_5G286600 [Panicum hallii var. hallii]|uniref:Uncharacterized protein n=1 Tax=Panicum hallii var. hallii TaxID=1504633 RepID=A0A2T7DL79_9POAL|nr:hypothetical protein GQ55_5G286600 [Panicum hallii var. hallii]